MCKPDFITPIKRFVEQLVAGNYQAVIDMSFVKERLNASDIVNEIKSYPGQITSPPDSAYEGIQVYPYVDESGYIITFALWFDHEESDLEIRVDVAKVEGDLRFTLWDMLVP